MEENKTNKKSIIISIVITFIVTLIMIFIILFINEYRNLKLTETTGIKNSKKIDYQLPNFAIVVNGLYDTTITNKDIEKVNVYSIGAVTTDGYVNTYNEYIGVKLKDILKERQLDQFNSITLKSNGGLSIVYEKKDIDDGVYLIFERNEVKLSKDEPVSIISLNVYERFSIDNLLVMEFE